MPARSRRILALLLAAGIAGCAGLPPAADPLSDAPEPRSGPVVAHKDAATYAEALQAWRSPEDVNAWIGARFEYSMPRAMLLSETQRGGGARIAIHDPEVFFGDPAGVCVDLARFAVETLGQVDPDANARYLMIEFAPVTVAGNTLRLHWMASFTRGGQRYFFADSKRPGHLAGPYASTQEFIEQYAAYRGRRVVRFAEPDSYRRQQRSMAVKQPSEEKR